MRLVHPAWVEHQRKRWLRPDADRYLRHDAERYSRPGPPLGVTWEAARLLFPDVVQEVKYKDDPVPTLNLAARERQAREERQRRAEILRLRSQIAALLFEKALVLHMIGLQRKANFDPNQPRVPAGNPDGGQWTNDGSGAGRINDTRVISDASDAPIPGAQYAELRRPGIGHNNPPPEIPKRRPPTIQARNLIAKLLARSSVAIAVLEAGPKWLSDHLAEIRSYRDPPKSLEELQRAVTPESTPGYQDHHIVGQIARGEPNKGFSDSEIDESGNIVRIPTMKHREISGWYQTHNTAKPFYGQTPRDYLFGKPWSERYRIGLETLRQFGVLKP